MIPQRHSGRWVLLAVLLSAAAACAQSAAEEFCTEVLRYYPQEFVDQNSWWVTCERVHNLDRLMAELQDPLVKLADTTTMSDVTSRHDSLSGTSVIRLSGFHGGDKFVALFDAELEKARLDNGLILDLRGAGGGEIETAGKVMARVTVNPIEGVRVQKRLAGLEQTKEVPYQIMPRGEWQFEGPVVILTDGGTHWPSQVILLAARSRLQMESVGVPTMGTKAVEPRIVSLPGRIKVQIPTATVLTPHNVKLTGQTEEPDLNINKEPVTAFRHPTDQILYRGTDELYRLIGRLEWLRDEMRKQAEEEKAKTGE